MEIIPYKNTLYSLMIEQFKWKYFQNILNPSEIAHIPAVNELEIHLIKSGTNSLSAWYPFQNKWLSIPFDQIHNYAEISEEQFKEYEKNKDKLSNIVLAHENSEIIKYRKQKEQS